MFDVVKGNCARLFSAPSTLRVETSRSYVLKLPGSRWYFSYFSGTPWRVTKPRRDVTSSSIESVLTAWRHRMISELITQRMAMNESTWLTVKVSKKPTSRRTIDMHAAFMQIDWLSCLLPMYFYLGRWLLPFMERMTVILDLEWIMCLV